jgi:PIN like domain
MRNDFRQYFRPTTEELNKLWGEGLFICDASVLLNIYGYSDKTREELVGFIRENSSRVRLPHQFGLEYARNRSSVIIKQVNNCKRVEDELRKIRDSDIAPKHEHPYLSEKNSSAFDEILKELEGNRKAMEKLIGSDPYLEKLFEIFKDRIGEAPSLEERSRLEDVAKERYSKRIPPGFADLKEKEVPDAYGDYVGWHQLMQIAKKEKKGVVFVIDDFKEDWWYLERQRTVGPRPELLEEFATETQQQLYMYTSENFLRAAKEFTDADIRDDLIEEVRDRLASQRETQQASGLKPPVDVSVSEADKSTGPGITEIASELKAVPIDSQGPKSPGN